MVGRCLRFVGTGGVAQVVAHLGAQGAFDKRFLERPRGIFGWDLGQHRRLRGSVVFLYQNRLQGRFGTVSRQIPY